MPDRRVVLRIEDGMDRQEWEAWFAGFFDGEGSIGCHAFAGRGGGRRVVFRVQLTQRADERPVLDEIHQRLGGSVYTHTSGAQWVLAGVPALLAVVAPLFERHPLHTKRAREWELVLPLLRERAGHPTRYYPDGFYERVAAVSRQLSEGRQSWTHLRKTAVPRQPLPLGRPRRRARSAN